MKLSIPRLSTRRLMLAVAVAGLILGGLDAARVHGLAIKHRRKAERCAAMERRCREIDAMDPATRAREADRALDNPYLNDPAWNRQMIGWWAAMKLRYDHAADNPRLPVPPDPPHP